VEPILDRLVCVAFCLAALLEFNLGLGGVMYTLDEARFVLGWRVVVGSSGCLKLELGLSWS